MGHPSLFFAPDSSNTRDALNRHVDKEDRDGVVIHDSIGRQQKAVIINESGPPVVPQGRRLKMAISRKNEERNPPTMVCFGASKSLS